ncbi:FGGY carbohydrate kinase domain-containing protein-like protein [Globomyces pollinis-pini]|nr:FGGY carbohydrate kinase domain-containing protein-like protein [Globomyces pollinis-pini]
MDYYIGVDVGTSSARAAIVDANGSILGQGVVSIQVINSQTNHFEQSSNDIWSSVSKAIRLALEESKIDVGQLKGIGFDATCSLVALDENYNPISVSATTNSESENIIMWMDHRAEEQAKRLTNSNHQILKRTGGSISPEMSVAKVIWLYENNSRYHQIKHLMELPEYLTWKATGCDRRSLNSLVCKWGYDVNQPMGWHNDFWKIGIKESDLDNLYSKCGGFDPSTKQPNTSKPGEPIGNGLSTQAALDFGLSENLAGLAVGGSVIDAYAGAIATFGEVGANMKELSTKMAIICGTSSCHIVMEDSSHFTKGVWGPYPDVILQDFYCLEGGQTLTGKAIEIFLNHHPSYESFKSKCSAKQLDVFEELNKLVLKLNDHHHPALMTRNVHVLPDCHGNRSPISDSTIRGSLIGISFEQASPNEVPQSLVIYYYATLLGVCYGTRHIIKSLNTTINKLCLSGGLASNRLFAQSLADVTGCNVVLPKVDSNSAVLLGAAMCGYAAHKGGLWDAMIAMSGKGEQFVPNQTVESFHAAKYLVFLKLYEDQASYRLIMDA